MIRLGAQSIHVQLAIKAHLKKVFKEPHLARYLDKARYLTWREFVIARMRVNIKQPAERELIRLVLMSGLPLVPLSKQDCSFD